MEFSFTVDWAQNTADFSFDRFDLSANLDAGDILASASVEPVTASIGHDFEGNATIDLDVATDIDLSLDVDWKSGSVGFDLNNLSFDASADMDDLAFQATLGPAAIGIGDAARELATATLALGGAVSYIDGNFEFTPGENASVRNILLGFFEFFDRFVQDFPGK